MASWIVAVATLTLVVSLVGLGDAFQPGVCEPIKGGICKDMFYDYTRMPNMFNHHTQEEANKQANHFNALVQINCSPDLRLFVCATHLPLCAQSYSKPVPPCRSLCERVRAGCLSLMRQYDSNWPDNLRCDQFPESSANMPCIDRPEKEGQSLGTGLATHPQPPSTPKARITTDAARESTGSGEESTSLVDLHASQVLAARELVDDRGYDGRMAELRKHSAKLKCQCSCRDPLIQLPAANKELFRNTITAGVRGCARPCRSNYFRREADQKFAEFWIGLWAVICALSTLLTVITFLADLQRFQYPERPIVYLALCYLFVAIGILIRVFVGHEAVVCDNKSFLIGNSTGQAHKVAGLLKKTVTGSAGCASTFLLTYFFGSAASLWWLMLTLTWLLSAALKWSPEAISKYSQLFHFIAWSLPGLQTGLVLMLSAVEGDPVTGLCSVGVTSSRNLLAAIFVPQAISLTLGLIFLVTGFVALIRIRQTIKGHSGLDLRIEKLENLMMRIGVFGTLYIVPGVVFLACLGYELRNRELWDLAVACDCRWVSGIDGRPLAGLTYQPPKPEFALFMLKYLMALVAGIVCSFWIWSHKTLRTWRTVCARVTGRAGNKRSPGYGSHAGLKYSTVNETAAWTDFTNSSKSKTAAAMPLPPLPASRGIPMAKAEGSASPPVNNCNSNAVISSSGLGSEEAWLANTTSSLSNAGYYQINSGSGSHGSNSNYSKVSSYNAASGMAVNYSGPATMLNPNRTPTAF